MSFWDIARDLVFSWASLSTLIGIAAAAGALFGPPLLLSILPPTVAMNIMPKVRHICLLVAIYAFGFTAIYGMGYRKAESTCNANVLKAHIATLEADLAAAKSQAARSEKHALDIAAAAAANDKQVDAINVVVQARPPAERCSLSADDARRLRDIK